MCTCSLDYLLIHNRMAKSQTGLADIWRVDVQLSPAYTSLSRKAHSLSLSLNHAGKHTKGGQNAPGRSRQFGIASGSAAGSQSWQCLARGRVGKPYVSGARGRRGRCHDPRPSVSPGFSAELGFGTHHSQLPPRDRACDVPAAVVLTGWKGFEDWEGQGSLHRRVAPREGKNGMRQFTNTWARSTFWVWAALRCGPGQSRSGRRHFRAFLLVAKFWKRLCGTDCQS